MNEFAFESYGVKIRVDCNNDELFEKAVTVVRRTLLDRLSIIGSDAADRIFTLRQNGSRLYMDLDGEDLGDGESEFIFLKYLDTRVRLLVAELAVGYVFMHAGVVSWNDRLIVFPADSFSGKTTLVAEFVRQGAVYYSDEYAVLDSDGNVHPFARSLSIRDNSGNYLKAEVSAESLGGIIGLDPKPVSLVLLIKYRARARWKPVILTSGIGVMKMMTQAISLRFHSKFTLEVLNKVASHAIIAESYRNNAKNSVKKIIDLIDNL